MATALDKDKQGDWYYKYSKLKTELLFENFDQYQKNNMGNKDLLMV